MPKAVTVDPEAALAAELAQIDARLEKKLGRGSIHMGDESQDVYHCPVPSPYINYATGGGFAFGRWASFAGHRSSFKALSLDTRIPTPSGWTTMGQVEVGDFVFDEQGEPTRVCGASHVYLDRPCYEVVFDDGSSIVADEDHRWLTSTYYSRMSKAVAERRVYVGQTRHRQEHRMTVDDVVTTSHIADTCVLQFGDGNKAYNHAIDSCQPLNLPEADLPLDPYILGVWLGDGSRAKGEVTTVDDEILGQIMAAGFEVGRPDKRTGIRYPVYGLATKLRAAGVLFDKHVPDRYLRASASQRLALLQGLMDTDGTISKTGNCMFVSSREVLTQAVHDLLVTLGIKSRVIAARAMLDGKDAGPIWRLHFTTKVLTFRLSRKLKRMRPEKVRSGRAQRKIREVRRVDSVPVRCIMVDSDSHLFLAGDSMVPTHNTRCGYDLMAALQQLPASAERVMVPQMVHHQRIADDGRVRDELRRGHQSVVERLTKELAWIRENYPSGANCVYYNAEGQWDKLHARRCGIDVSKVKLVESMVIEDICEAMEAYFPHYVMHFVDSTSQAASIDVAKLDMTKASPMALDARQWKECLKRAMLTSWDRERNIGLLVHHLTTNRKGVVSPNGGAFLGYISSCLIRFSHGEFLWRKDGILREDKPDGADDQSMVGRAQADGREIFAQVEKSRVCRPFRIAALFADYANHSYDHVLEYIGAGLYLGLITKSTPYYKVVGDEKSVQGLAKLHARVKGDIDLQERIQCLLLDHVEEELAV